MTHHKTLLRIISYFVLLCCFVTLAILFFLLLLPDGNQFHEALNYNIFGMLNEDGSIPINIDIMALIINSYLVVGYFGILLGIFQMMNNKELAEFVIAPFIIGFLAAIYDILINIVFIIINTDILNNTSIKEAIVGMVSILVFFSSFASFGCIFLIAVIFIILGGSSIYGDETDFLKREKGILSVVTGIYGLMKLIGTINPSAYFILFGNVILTTGLLAALVVFYRLIRVYLTHNLPYFGWGVEE